MSTVFTREKVCGKGGRFKSYYANKNYVMQLK